MNAKKEAGYLDIHSHVIYGVDDGSKSLEMSVGMLQKNYDEGVRTMIATPHNYHGREHYIDLIKERHRILAEKALKIDEGYRLLLGNEILYRKNILQELEQGECLTMNGTRHVLVEFLPGESYDTIFEGLMDLVREDYVPIIAHIERVNCLHDSYRKIKDLVDMGCYMQINTEILTGGMFNVMTKKVLNYIDLNFIHFIGTDCHNLTTRPPAFRRAVQKLHKRSAESAVDFLKNCDIF